ncbi:hypothetical protein GCM10009116_05140 [Brevundimonas basaltis]|uniref:DUF4279 domain-containing protein n=1 Tax=Brevundimonas basaltis TaxID=472166 RepID=A0A7W8MH08_9CAUL|nr:DUF4279 domain-containing protein [Brevundimonas basaltis]MBB5292783.1 hypothetical protein [Brevundimonas basaltis]
MGGIHETSASLGFYGDDLDPDEITIALGARPTVGVRKGQTWVTEFGAEKVARTGSWRVVAQRSPPGDLDGQIAGLLSTLTDDLAVWNDLASRFRGRLFCGLFLKAGNEGATLKPETVLAMGSRGLCLDLDIYGAEMLD